MTHPLDEGINSMCSGHLRRRPREGPGTMNLKLGSFEVGWKADCWFCGKRFTKAEYCPDCDLYRCPSCGKCGCNLSEEARHAVIVTLEAVRRNQDELSA